MAPTSDRYQARKARGSWYVEDTHTGGAVMTGMVRVGARRLADHLNRERGTR